MTTETLYDLLAHYDSPVATYTKVYAEKITGERALEILRGPVTNGDGEPDSWELVPANGSHS